MLDSFPKTHRVSLRRTAPGNSHRDQLRRSARLCLEELEPRELLATYYVSPTGNDAYNGTSTATPWRTITRVNAQDFEPGDTIRFQGGRVFNGGLVFDSADNGSQASPITVNSYGTGRATIRSGMEIGLYAQDTAGFVISNLNFVGAGMDINMAYGISFLNVLPGDVELRRVHIDNVDVSRYGADGIVLWGFNGLSGYRDVRITNSKLHHNLAGGLAMYGPDVFDLSTRKVFRDVYIGHVDAYANAGNHLVPELYAPGNGMTLAAIDGGVIERNLTYGNGLTNGMQTGYGNAGVVMYNCNNVTVQFNESYNNRTALDDDGGGFDFDWGMTNSLMQYNYSHNNDGYGLLFLGFPGYFHSNVTMRYNVSENDGRTNYGGIMLYGLVDAEVHNNTVYTGASAAFPNTTALLLWGDYTRVRVRNNIFQTGGGVRVVTAVEGVVGSDILIQDNAYWSSGAAFRILWGTVTYTSMAAWQTAVNQEKIGTTLVGHQVNPQLTSPGQGGTIGNADLLGNLAAYRLRSTSPLRDAGTNLLTAFGVNPGTRDFYGTALAGVTAFSIGAHEL